MWHKGSEIETKKRTKIQGKIVIPEHLISSRRKEWGNTGESMEETTSKSGYN